MLSFLLNAAQAAHAFGESLPAFRRKAFAAMQWQHTYASKESFMSASEDNNDSFIALLSFRLVPTLLVQPRRVLYELPVAGRIYHASVNER